MIFANSNLEVILFFSRGSAKKKIPTMIHGVSTGNRVRKMNTYYYIWFFSMISLCACSKEDVKDKTNTEDTASYNKDRSIKDGVWEISLYQESPTCSFITEPTQLIKWFFPVDDMKVFLSDNLDGTITSYRTTGEGFRMYEIFDGVFETKDEIELKTPECSEKDSYLSVYSIRSVISDRNSQDVSMYYDVDYPKEDCYEATLIDCYYQIDFNMYWVDELPFEVK